MIRLDHAKPRGRCVEGPEVHTSHTDSRCTAHALERRRCSAHFESKPGVDLVTLMGEDVKWFFEAAAGACEEAHDATPAARLERRGGL